MRVNDKCPYDPSHKNTGVAVNKSQRWLAVCPVCNRSARVTMYSESKTCKLSKVGRKFTGNAKEKFQIGLSPLDQNALKDGRAVLTFSNNRIQLLYKH